MPLLQRRFLLISSAAILGSLYFPDPAIAQDSDNTVQLSPRQEPMDSRKHTDKEEMENNEDEDNYDYEDDYDPYADSITSPRPRGAFDEDDPDGLEDIEDLDPELTEEYREEVNEDDEEEDLFDRNDRRREEMEIRRELRKKRREEPYSEEPY